MNKLRKFLPLILLTWVAFAATSCKKDKIEVSESDLWFNAAGGSRTIEITANNGWKIVKNDDMVEAVYKILAAQEGV